MAINSNNLLSLMMNDLELTNLKSEMTELVKSISSSVRTHTTTINQDNINYSNIVIDSLKSIDEINKKKDLNSILNQTGQNDIKKEFDNLFQDVNVPTERLMRYDLYQQFVDSIPIIKVINDTYLANIFIKNPISGKSLIIKPVNEQENIISNKKSSLEEDSKHFIESMIDYFGLTDKLKHKIISTRLTFGDCFVELVDIEEYSKNLTISGNAGITPNILTESDVNRLSKSVDNYLKNNRNNKTDNGFVNNDEIKLISEIVNSTVNFNSIPEDIITATGQYEENKLLFEDEMNSITSEELSKAEKEAVDVLDKENTKKILKERKQKNFNFNKVLLRVIKPHEIVILETRYGTRLGYLEINKAKQGLYNNVSRGLSQVVGRLLSSKSTETDNHNHRDNIIKKIINFIVNKVSDGVKNDLMQVTGKEKDILIDKAIQDISPELYEVLKRLIVEQKLNNTNYEINSVNTRFIPTSKIIHFKSPGFHSNPPYSASILDPLVLPGKLYILSQLANIMTKLSRAAVIRKWKLETGASNMHSSMIQQIRRELYNTRLTLNDLSNFKTIPKVLTDFKDLFIFTKNGQQFVDVDVQPLGDASIKVNMAISYSNI
jgi:hypothetical protein